MTDKNLDTLVNHPPKVTLRGSNRPVVAPIYQSVKFTADSLSEMKRIFTENNGEYVYSRVSNPTVRQLELLLAEMQGQEDGLCVGSGVAALTAVLFAHVKAGDHILMFYESYKPTRYLVTDMLKRFRVSASLIFVDDIDQLQAHYQPGKTKLLICESPTNPMTRIVDLEKITDFCQKHKIISVLDNTFAGFHNHGQYPIDLYVHSLTKFACGHGDVMGGAILGKRSLIRAMHEDTFEMGAVLDPHAAYLIQRGMKTYTLRYERQCQNALKIAQWLEQKSAVKKVYYPGLKSHPDFELAKKQLKDFGTVVSLELDDQHSSAETFIDTLKLIQLSGSLGSTETLVAPCELFYGSDLTTEQKSRALISSHTVRLAIGTEDCQDLISDLEQAL